MNEEDGFAFPLGFGFPEVPKVIISRAPFIKKTASKFSGYSATAFLAGLQTDYRFQANSVRLDWCTRILLATSRGKRSPTWPELFKLLNTEIGQDILLLEDPIEDFFAEPVATPRGEFLIFSGTWEKAALHTESIIASFSMLPAGKPKEGALKSIYALLALSDSLAKRSAVSRWQVGLGQPKGTLRLPSIKELKVLHDRVHFTDRELESLRISPNDLKEFCSAESDLDSLAEQPPGNSTLEFRPLLRTEHGFLVAAPSNISTAVRSALISRAVDGGMANHLRENLLDTHSILISQSGFTKLHTAQPSRDFSRQYIEELSEGRFVHFMQFVDDFSDWPYTAFSPRQAPDGLFTKVKSSVDSARESMRKLPGFREGISFILFGGWGRGYSVPIDDELDVDLWPVVFLDVTDPLILSGCKHGSIRDLWRFSKQLRLVTNQGFEFFNLSGLLNIFQWWRDTELSFVPPHEQAVVPPLAISIGTDLLLKTRRESVVANDRRVLPFPDETYRLVTRMHTDTAVGDLAPIYCGSIEVLNRDLLGAVLSDGGVLWVKLDIHYDDPNAEDKIETWQAALHWMADTLSFFLKTYNCRLNTPLLLYMKIEYPETLSKGHANEINADNYIYTSIDNGVTAIHIRGDWHLDLHRADNRAELSLAVQLLSCVAVHASIAADKDELRNLLLEVIESTDYRWRHSLQAVRASDVLSAGGLTSRLRPIPASAGALIKCGMAWNTHAREQGTRFENKEACVHLLAGQAQFMLRSLRAQVAKFNRTSIVSSALHALQAAASEIRQWEISARALRAIHGADADYRGSLDRSAEINAVIRASSILAEVASAEASTGDGLAIGDMDLAELQAQATLLFKTIDMIPAINLDRIPPILEISPTGDILSDHDFEKTTLQRAAERRHRVDRQESSFGYDKLFLPERPTGRIGDELKAAITAEYRVTAEVFLSLGSTLANLALKRRQGVLVLRRSELVSALAEESGETNATLTEMVDRLTLPSRPNWEYLPEGCNTGDFDLGKFDRPYSLIGRPLIALSADADMEVAVAPAVVERSVVHNLAGAMYGTLQNRFWSSRTMQIYASASGAKAGLDFNKKVADALSSQGLSTSTSVKLSSCLNQKATDELKSLGDIDVLAITANGTKALIIEAKDLKMCRTLGETARRLADYRGIEISPGKPDKMLRHLRRVEYVRRNASNLASRMRLPVIPEVIGLMVVRAPQPMEVLVTPTSKDARAVMLDDIQDVIRDLGN